MRASFFLILTAGLPLLHQCSRCSCNCERKPGERQLRAFTPSGDSLLEDIRFTYDIHVDQESIHAHAISEFLNAYADDSILEERSHTAWEREYDLSCRQGRERQASGGIVYVPADLVFSPDLTHNF